MKPLSSAARIALKALAFLPLFLLLHYAYEWLPWPGLAWFSSTGETVYSHMKIAFFAYLLLCGLEYALVRPPASARDGFFYSRLFASVLLPWGIFFGWYLGPAIYGAPMPNDAIEIVYANLVTLGVLVLVGVIERGLEPYRLPRGLRAALWIIAAVLVLEFVIFSYRPPWADVFTPPPGWE